VIELTESLPKSRVGVVISRQVLRSATSVGANYRAACRGKSTADVLAKLAIVEEEADETAYWVARCGRDCVGIKGGSFAQTIERNYRDDCGFDQDLERTKMRVGKSFLKRATIQNRKSINRGKRHG
jgi:four helix bundle protein